MPLAHIGRYTIIEELGRGAMGVVYKAHDPLLDRTVAIKTVDLTLTREEGEAFEERFYREAKSAGSLNHVNIVTIYDVGKTDDVAYIAMELLEGQSLKQILDSGAFLPPDTVATIATQVADGLAFAHAHDIVHRDIKPANIMVLDRGIVKITDFGIALLPRGSRTVAGAVFGSPKYISPEQVAGHHVDRRCDIFSLGAVLYEMLTGLPPFDADDLNAILYKVMNETPLPPTVRNRSIPSVFDHIVAKALAKIPEDRYQTAEEMASDLRELRGIESPRANAVGSSPVRPGRRTPGIAGTLGSWRRRNILLVGVPAALIVVVGAWGLARKRAPRSEESAAKIAAASGPPLVAAPPSTPVEAAAPVETIPPPVAAPAAREAPPPKPMGRLVLAVTPWGVVYVDGIRKGISPPLTEIKLTPGKHVVEIRNTTFRTYRQSVNLRGEGSVKIKHKFK
jgi:eukaryotic-like serine/threonine-protein kinase